MDGWGAWGRGRGRGGEEGRGVSGREAGGEGYVAGEVRDELRVSCGGERAAREEGLCWGLLALWV